MKPKGVILSEGLCSVATIASSTARTAEGMLYPNVIESVSFTGGPSVTIKSHHNVSGFITQDDTEIAISGDLQQYHPSWGNDGTRYFRAWRI